MKLDYANPVNGRNPLNRGLVLYWRGLPTRTTPNRVVDLVSRNNGTLNNGAALSNRWCPAGCSSLAFDGVDDYAATVLDLDQSAYTVSMWVFPTSATQYQRVAITPNSYSNQWILVYSDTSSQQFVWVTNNGGTERTKGSGAAAASKWHHVIGTFAASTATLYWNGVSVANSTDSGYGLSAGSGIWFGQRHNSSQQFAGNLADVRIYNRALGATEAMALYRQSAQAMSPLLKWRRPYAAGMSIAAAAKKTPFQLFNMVA